MVLGRTSNFQRPVWGPLIENRREEAVRFWKLHNLPEAGIIEERRRSAVICAILREGGRLL